MTGIKSDEKIVDRILKGEKRLYEELMRKYNERLFRISMSIINDKTEAKDVMQTTYLHAYEQLPSFKKKSSFSTWLIRILINESLLRKKKKLKQEELFKRPTDNKDNNTPLNSLLNKELKTLLEKAIAELPEKYRLVFVMREIEEMSVKETMEVLNLTESNIKVRLNRAKEMLRMALSDNRTLKQVFKFDELDCDKVVNYTINKINKNLNVTF